MIWLQLSANTGPSECCLGVSKALQRVQQEAAAAQLTVSLIEQADGPVTGTLRSVLLQIDGGPAQVQALAWRWQGSILWVCSSPYRKGHKRKNWFLHGACWMPPEPASARDDGSIRYEALRASGPGGQHVNKTDSAIRATHVASGLSVKVQSQRSQHANKKLAAQLLASKLAGLHDAVQASGRAERRLAHHGAERGNAVRVFEGSGFIER
ncbi:MAG: peptide chain release factor H [Duganella sp.]